MVSVLNLLSRNAFFYKHFADGKGLVVAQCPAGMEKTGHSDGDTQSSVAAAHPSLWRGCRCGSSKIMAPCGHHHIIPDGFCTRGNFGQGGQLNWGFGVPTLSQLGTQTCPSLFQQRATRLMRGLENVLYEEWLSWVYLVWRMLSPSLLSPTP